MSIRSNGTGALEVPVTGGPGDAGAPLTMCAWVKVMARAGGFGSVLVYEDSFFNVAPGIILTNLDDGLYFTPAPGTNNKIVDNALGFWSFVGLSWDGSTIATAVGLDHNGVWIENTAASAGANVPPFVFIGGQNIGGGVITPDGDMLYRGVHLWKEKKSTQFLKQQSRQLAPISEVNLWSTLFPYDLSTKQLGLSRVGHPWQDAEVVGPGSTWTTSSDEPPRPSTTGEPFGFDPIDP